MKKAITVSINHFGEYEDLINNKIYEFLKSKNINCVIKVINNIIRIYKIKGDLWARVDINNKKGFMYFLKKEDKKGQINLELKINKKDHETLKNMKEVDINVY